MRINSGVALKREVFDAFVDRGAFPQHKFVEKAFISKGFKYSSKNYTAIRRGELAPEGFAPHFIQCVLTSEHHQFRIARDVLVNHVCPSLGISEAELTSVSEIARLLCTRDERAQRQLDGRDKDWVALGVIGLAKAMMSARRVRKAVRSCADAASVRAAVRWGFIDCGRELADRPGVDDDTAIKICADKLCVSFTDCADRTIELWKRNPWTILLAACDDRPVATCVALPLKPATGAALAAGKLNPFAIGPSDLQTPSTYTWTEMACVDPSLTGMQRRRATKALTLTLAAQGAAIARIDLLPADAEIHTVSFAVARTGIRRLKRYGYKKLGPTTPNSEIPLVGRRLVNGRGDDIINFLWIQTLSVIGRDMSDLPPPRMLC